MSRTAVIEVHGCLIIIMTTRRGGGGGGGGGGRLLTDIMHVSQYSPIMGMRTAGRPFGFLGWVVDDLVVYRVAMSVYLASEREHSLFAHPASCIITIIESEEG
eukprot:scaffold8252_cov226-Amphora_coffeaeformis.AAC.1